MAVVIRAETRETKPKSVLRKLRKAGKVPAIVYGKDTNGAAIAVDAMEMDKVLHDEGDFAILDLEVAGGQAYKVMVSEVQKDPLKRTLTHLDFQTIRMDEPVDSEVVIELVGEARGVKDGGVLQHGLRALEVRTLPDARPDAITCSIDDLSIGDSINVAQLEIPEGVEVLTNPEEVVISVVAPVMEDAEDADDADAPEAPKLVENTTDDGSPE